MALLLHLYHDKFQYTVQSSYVRFYALHNKIIHFNQHESSILFRLSAKMLGIVKRGFSRGDWLRLSTNLQWGNHALRMKVSEGGCC